MRTQHVASQNGQEGGRQNGSGKNFPGDGSEKEYAFTLKFGKNGVSRFPADMRKVLGMVEGDSLKITIVDKQIKSAVVSRSEPFDIDVTKLLLSRLSSSGISLKPDEIIRALDKREPNGER